MDEPEIALAFSPEPWFEALHRHLCDHGGARVRQVVMDPALAFVEHYDVLVVSHRWPALTRGFVERAHTLGRTVLGVHDPSEPPGQEFLAGLEVDAMVANDASMPEFVDALGGVLPDLLRRTASGRPRVRPPRGQSGDSDPDNRRRARLTAIAGTPGAGRTEIALALAVSTARTGEGVLLLDADELAPSLQQRLGQPMEPNLRTAIEAVVYGVGDPGRVTNPVARGLALVGGLPNAALWSQVRPGEVLDVIDALGVGRRHVLADVSSCLEPLDEGGASRFGISRAILGQAATVVGVGVATPVGVSRLLAWIGHCRGLNQHAPVHLVVNRSDRNSYREAEIEREVRRTFEPASLTFVPEDRRIDAATWAADVVAHGSFTRAIGKLAATVFPSEECTSRKERRDAARSASGAGA